MESLLESLVELFATAVNTAYPDVPDAPVPLAVSGSSQFGDYQCNAAMPIAQLLKGQGMYYIHILNTNVHLFINSLDYIIFVENGILSVN